MLVIGPSQFRFAAQFMAGEMYEKNKPNADGSITLTRAELELGLFVAIEAASFAAIKSVKRAEDTRQDFAVQAGAFNDETREPDAAAVARAERNGGYSDNLGIDDDDRPSNVVGFKLPNPRDKKLH